MKLKSLGAWVTPNQRLVLLVSLFIMLTGNITFLERVAGIYSFEQGNWAFLLSVFCLFTAATAFLLNLVSYRTFTAPVLALFLLISSATAYFMDKYGTVLNDEMLINMLQTNVSEAVDLLSLSMMLRLVFLGLIPAFLLIRFKPRSLGHAAELRGMLFTGVLLILFMAACIAPFTSSYASFFREHKTVRFYANPTYVTYSAVSLAGRMFKDQGEKIISPVATDAKPTEILESE